MSETIPPPNDDGVSYGFCKKDAGRVAEATRRVEDYFRLPPPQRGRWPVSGAGASLTAVLTPSGGIDAGTFDAPASADVTVLKPNSGAPGFTTTGSTTKTMYNTYTTGITGVKFCWSVTKNGYLYLVVGDC